MSSPDIWHLTETSRVLATPSLGNDDNSGTLLGPISFLRRWSEVDAYALLLAREKNTKGSHANVPSRGIVFFFFFFAVKHQRRNHRGRIQQEQDASARGCGSLFRFFTICASVRDARIVFSASLFFFLLLVRDPRDLLMRCTFSASRRSLFDVATACGEVLTAFCFLSLQAHLCRISCHDRVDSEIQPWRIS